MNRFWIGSAAALACLAVFAFASSAASSPKGIKSPWIVKPALSFQGLQVFPIVQAPGFPVRDVTGYITLDEGLKSGTVIVTEKGAPQPLIRNRPPAGRGGRGFEEPADPQAQQAQSAGQTANQRLGSNSQQRQFAAPAQGGAQVNTLYIVNKSGRKLILLAGEMVVGGKQDRIIQKDGLIPPTGTPFDLSVFCVEQGRWHGDTVAFKPADNSIVKGGGGGFGGAVADPTVRGEAQANRSQSGVWTKVGEKNRQVNASPTSGTYQAAVSSPKAQQDAKPYHDAILPKMPKNAVGAVIAIHGQLVWVDAFPSAELFQAYWPKLLQSYIVDAMTTPPPPKTANERIPRVLRSVPSVEEAQRYLEDRSGKSTFEGQSDLYQLTRIEAPSHLIFELKDLSVNPDLVVHFNKMKKGR